MLKRGIVGLVFLRLIGADSPASSEGPIRSLWASFCFSQGPRPTGARRPDRRVRAANDNLPTDEGGCPTVCPSMSGDGYCDAVCDLPECGHDGGDCDAQCSPLCALSWIGDGYCDVECFNEACKFDGSDCNDLGDCGGKGSASWIGDGYCDPELREGLCGGDEEDCKETCAPGCSLSWLGDRACDEVCFTESCDWDRGDCRVWSEGFAAGQEVGLAVENSILGLLAARLVASAATAPKTDTQAQDLRRAVEELSLVESLSAYIAEYEEPLRRIGIAIDLSASIALSDDEVRRLPADLLAASERARPYRDALQLVFDNMDAVLSRTH
eukprot:Polyplicarium_translucidae@DN2014_c0_g1_i1.p1